MRLVEGDPLRDIRAMRSYLKLSCYRAESRFLTSIHPTHSSASGVPLLPHRSRVRSGRRSSGGIYGITSKTAHLVWISCSIRSARLPWGRQCATRLTWQSPCKVSWFVTADRDTRLMSQRSLTGPSDRLPWKHGLLMRRVADPTGSVGLLRLEENVSQPRSPQD